LALFVIGLVGTTAELILLEHTEDLWQRVPLALLGACGLVLAWRFFSKGSPGPQAMSLRVFQVLMGLFLVAGIAGLVLHFKGNAEFELEMYPSRRGFELIWESLKGATPALAPGMMIQLGLLGLASTYRHPLLSSRPSHGD